MTAIPTPGLNDAVQRDQPSGFSSLSSEDFIKIIFTELANQDPFQPNDSSALLEQMSSIRNIESDLEMMDRLQGLVFENQLSSGASLIGKSVEGLNIFNEQVGGTVTSVQRQGDDITLHLSDGQQIPIANVNRINEGQPAPAPAPAPVPPPQP